MEVKKFSDSVGVEYTINDHNRHSDGTAKEQVRIAIAPGERTQGIVRRIGKALERAASWFK